MIRDPDGVETADRDEIISNWRNKIFIRQEIELLKSLGIAGPEMLDRIFGPDKWGLKVSDFFYSLVKSDCFVDTKFLSNRECANTRRFVSELTSGLIKEITPSEALLYSDDTVGPILKVEKEKTSLQRSLSKTQADLAARLADIRAQREEFHRQREALASNIRRVKTITGLDPQMSTEEAEALLNKDLTKDSAIADLKSVAPGGAQSALQTMPAMGARTIYQDSLVSGNYLKQYILIKRGDRSIYTCNIFIEGAENDEDGAQKLTAKVNELTRKYPGWLIA
jgi:hypothetical protein